MIARIEGILEQLADGAAYIRVPESGMTWQVLVPAYTAARLGGSFDQPVMLHTLHFIESQNQGATMLPRLAGFLTIEDRKFFELFTTCKGIGFRKALRAMALRTDQIAAAIADRDAATLQSLPEIGKRTAETICVTLRGKVDAFLDATAFAAAASQGAAGVEADAARAPTGGLAREALEVLVALGENRMQAMQWIDRVLEDDDRPGDAESLVQRVYALKAGG